MKKGIICFILGMLVSSSAYAAIVLSSDKVGYNDTTVDAALNNLFDESVNGKNNIINTLSNKGFDIVSNPTYSDIINGINELPITLVKGEDGSYGYKLPGDDTILSFEADHLGAIKSLNFDLNASWQNATYTSYSNSVKVSNDGYEIIGVFTSGTTYHNYDDGDYKSNDDSWGISVNGVGVSKFFASGTVADGTWVAKAVKVKAGDVISAYGYGRCYHQGIAINLAI